MIKTATCGTCKTCGCTQNNPCYSPKAGFCWWGDEGRIVCSHCADEAIKSDRDTVHRVNDIPGWMPSGIKTKEASQCCD